MPKIILITGATDGIGRLTARMLAEQGHTLLLHGRSAEKLAATAAEVGGSCETYRADMAKLDEVQAMAEAILAKHASIDVLINNAGVLKTPQPRIASGLDTRFVVNTLAPHALTRALLPAIPKSGRIVNLSSAAQARVDLDALAGRTQLADMEAYAQSKLAITIMSRDLAAELPDGPLVVAVNPGSLLASKMVKEGFGMAGNDLSIGAKILCRAALDPSFEGHSGQYFDNDAGRFAAPHPAAEDAGHASSVMEKIEAVLSAELSH